MLHLCLLAKGCHVLLQISTDLDMYKPDCSDVSDANLRFMDQTCKMLQLGNCVQIVSLCWSVGTSAPPCVCVCVCVCVCSILKTCINAPKPLQAYQLVHVHTHCLGIPSSNASACIPLSTCLLVYQAQHHKPLVCL